MRHDAASADAHQHNQEETEMDATTVAVDLAKIVFEVAIADAPLAHRGRGIDSIDDSSRASSRPRRRHTS